MTLGIRPFTRLARLAHRSHRPLQDILRALLAPVLSTGGTAQGPHAALRRPPRLQGIRAFCAGPGGRVAAAAATARLLRKVRDEGRERGHACNDDSDGGLDNGPLDGFGGIEVVGQVADGLDADDLDNGDEETQSEETQEGNFTTDLHLELEEDGEREDERDYVKDDRQRRECEVKGNGISTMAGHERLPLLLDRNTQEQENQHKGYVCHCNNRGNRDGQQPVRPRYQAYVGNEQAGLEAPNAENIERGADILRLEGFNDSFMETIGRKDRGESTLPKLRTFSSGMVSSSISPRPHFVWTTVAEVYPQAPIQLAMINQSSRPTAFVILVLT